jgi:hypothetical protein
MNTTSTKAKNNKGYTKHNWIEDYDKIEAFVK